MVIGSQEDEEDLEINNNTINKTVKFTYLGSVITSDGKIETEINSRIAKYSKNVGALYPLLRDPHIHKRIKTHIYNSILKPILLYACETWVMTERLKSKIQAAEMRVLRLIFGVTKRDRVRNTTIRAALKVEPIILQIEKCQLRWFGHTQRMQPTRDVKRIMDWVPTGKRRRGRPRTRWKDGIQSILTRIGMDLEEAAEACQDRGSWRRTVKNIPTDRLT